MSAPLILAASHTSHLVELAIPPKIKHQTPPSGTNTLMKKSRDDFFPPSTYGSLTESNMEVSKKKNPPQLISVIARGWRSGSTVPSIWWEV